MKDLVRRPQQKYDTLFRELQRQSMQPDSKLGTGNNSTDPSNDALKNELKRYLMELNTNSMPRHQNRNHHPCPIQVSLNLVRLINDFEIILKRYLYKNASMQHVSTQSIK